MARRVLHDHYFKQAKAEGYLARSAFKLQQINEAKRLIRRGQRVLDLGCAPGAWLQVASEIVGEGGTVVGIDLKPISRTIAPNVAHMVADAEKVDPAVLLALGVAEPRLFDVVLSDMAPNTTGHGDDLVSARLCERVLDLCPNLLKPTGNLAMKILEGGETPAVLKRLRQMFTKAMAYKPDASRDVSRETYLIGLGYVPAKLASQSP
jgi:23S rRNA (uridine2552-2'-O)-methyltransferase